jgi:hypothetical protein
LGVLLRCRPSPKARNVSGDYKAENMRKFWILIILVVFITEYTHGCDCVSRTFEQHLTQSDEIIVAQVIKQEITWIKQKDKISSEENPDTLICNYDLDGVKSDRFNFCIPVTVFTLKIQKQFKGEIVTSTIKVISIYSSNCYPNLHTGYEYIFYLFKTDESDIYNQTFNSYISQCSRIEMTNNFIEVGDKRMLEIEYLQKIKKK